MKNKAYQQNCKVISNKRVGGHYFKMIVNSAKIAGFAKPGQFVEVRISSGCEPLLRRPFGVHKAFGVNIEILYEVLGAGTRALSQKNPGECLDIIGPLGNGFDYLPPATGHRPPVLVAGGMGVAPLIFLAEKLVKSKIKNQKSKIIVLIGAKTKDNILCEKEFRDFGCDVKIATDDGSRGFKGRVTDLLKDILRTAQGAGRTALYACGPRPMLKEISRISRQCNVPAQISLEEHMACGIGACLGCIVNTKKGFKRVCKEGPIFEADEIIW